MIISTAFLLGYAGRFVEPSPYLWWIQLVAIPLPYVSVVAGFFAIGQLLRGSGLVRRVVSFAILVLIVVRFYPVLSGSGGTYDSSSDFSLLSYNIPAERVRQHPAGVLQLSKLAAETNADVVCLQESYWYYRQGPAESSGRPDVKELQALGFNLKPSVDRTFGVEQVTVTKLPNAKVEYWLKPSGPRDPDVLAILRSTIEWEGRDFAIYNIHLASYGTSKPWRERNRIDPRVWLRYLRDYRFAILHRAWQVEQVLEATSNESLPYLIVGDFNATPHNWSYWRIAKDLIDTFMEAGKGSGLTYHEKRPTFRIDFILMTDDFEATSSRTLVGEVSDHLAVNTTLRWRTRPE